MFQGVYLLGRFYLNYIAGKYEVVDYKEFSAGGRKGYFLVLKGRPDEADLEAMKRNKLFKKTYIYKDEDGLALLLVYSEEVKFPVLNLVLFLATVLSTFFVGALHANSNPFGMGILSGWMFSLPLLLIIGVHELGHFVLARRFGIPASWPYFIPFPSLIGTLGAVISIRGFIPSRRALLYMAFAGPLASFVVSIPIIVLGFTLPDVHHDSYISFGKPLVLYLLDLMFPSLGISGDDIILHPVRLAGWVGLFVTALNLIPMGQLDGGHILYALFPKIHRKLGFAVIALLLFLGFTTWNGWWIWALFGIFMGVRHPPVMFSEKSITRKEIAVGWASVGMLLLCFSLTPIRG